MTMVPPEITQIIIAFCITIAFAIVIADEA